MFLGSFFLLYINRYNLSTVSSIPLIFLWIGVVLIGNFLNRLNKEGGYYYWGRISLSRFTRIIFAAYIFNFYLDLTGGIFMRLWYYPNLNMPWYYTFFAPMGYIVYGLVLILFYRYFKAKMDDYVSPGRMTNFQSKIYKDLMEFTPFFSIPVFALTFLYMLFVAGNYSFNILDLNSSPGIPSNIVPIILNHISLFFLLEYLCYRRGFDSFIKGIIRGNYIPLIAIFLASFICILLIEVSNTPLQIWKFDNWPLNDIRFANIPVLAYLTWPIQFLLILPILRLIDSNNRENVW